jgi:hypothetical protein
MKTTLMTAAAVVASTLTVASGALAQSQTKDEVKEDSGTHDLSAPTHALELTIGTGYEQGFGNVGGGQPRLTDLSTAGGAIQVGVGYRLLPQLTLGVYGSGAMFGRGDQVDSTAKEYSAAAGVQADWHFLPAGRELDPWISLGTGWRGYWIHTDSAGDTSLQGLEIAKLQVGLDYRVDRAVSLGPVVGVDMSTFLSQSTPASNGFSNISSPNVNTFLFAGLMGRFDVPTQPDRSQVASR